MTRFSLIKHLEEHANNTSPMKNNIKYQRYILEVDNNDVHINIPIRESIAFETYVAELTSKLNSDSLRSLLRKYRGTRN